MTSNTISPPLSFTEVYLVLPFRTELGLGQTDLPAAARVNLGSPRITSPVTSHSVPTELASVTTVVLPVVWPSVLPTVLPTVVLTLGHQDAHHGQEERLVIPGLRFNIFLANSAKSLQCKPN